MDVVGLVNHDLVLCINSGSSSLKFSVIEMTEEERLVAEGTATSFEHMFDLLREWTVAEPTVVGHRVVHGGPRHVEPALVDDALLAELRALVPLAPLHLPAAIEGIALARARLPGVPQVACFDTAFHASMPEVARRLPIPDRFAHAGVRRYGFHGLSYEWVMSELGTEAPARIVIAHLGNGSSLCAVKDGRSVDTTMGFTPTGGVMMGSRSGDLDPGVLVYLARTRGFSADELEELVDHESGLRAVGRTSDMQELLERAPTDARARLAIDMFVHSVKKAIGSLVAVLGGLDLLVFTGGIGENATEVRTQICRGLETFGTFETRIVAANEDLVIARHAQRATRVRA